MRLHNALEETRSIVSLSLNQLKKIDMKDMGLVVLIVGFVTACIAISLLGECLFPPVPTESELVTKCLTAINEGNAACDKGYYSLAQIELSFSVSVLIRSSSIIISYFF